MHLEIPSTMTIIRDDIEQCRFTSARVSKKNVPSIQKGHRLRLTSTILSKLYGASLVLHLLLSHPINSSIWQVVNATLCLLESKHLVFLYGHFNPKTAT